MRQRSLDLSVSELRIASRYYSWRQISFIFARAESRSDISAKISVVGPFAAVCKINELLSGCSSGMRTKSEKLR